MIATVLAESFCVSFIFKSNDALWQFPTISHFIALMCSGEKKRKKERKKEKRRKNVC
jgi:hypothetical protein